MNRAAAVLLPKHRISRRIAAGWLLICLITLAVLLLRPGLYADDRNALAALVPMYWLSLPLGHVGVMAGIDIRTALYVAGSAPGLLAEGLYLWFALALLGYVQWFLLLPLVARLCQRILRLLFDRNALGDRQSP